MPTVMLGVGDLGVSGTPGDVLKTLALGSCVALILLDPRTRSVGMVHVALPESSINAEKAMITPGYFADTGVRELLARMARLTGSMGCTRYMVKLVGGAQVLAQDSAFNIGRRNELAIKKLLWDLGMGVHAQDVGGHISRSVAVDVDTGRVVITSAGRGGWEL